MYKKMLEQATELFILGQELEQQQEILAVLYGKECLLDSPDFVEEYEKLSSLSEKFMRLEMEHNSLLAEALVSRRWMNKYKSVV